MKFLTTLCLFIVFSSLSFGQSKYVKKSERLYLNGKYEKCIKNTTKYLSKEKKSADLQFFIVASNLKLSKASNSQTKKYLSLKKTIKSWGKLQKYNIDNKDFSSLKDSIVAYIYLQSESDYIKRNRLKNQFLHNKLAEHFSDTTETYRVLHTPATKKPVEVVIDESLTDHRLIILKKAEALIGKPYKYGGTDTTGFDCSGFTQYLYKQIDIDLPHNASRQSKLGKKVKLKDAKPGDLIFFGKSSAFHAGMIFNNKNGEIELIHCVSGGVDHQAYDDVNTQYWLKRVLCVKRFIEE